MKQAYGAINRQAEVNHTQVLNRTLLIFCQKEEQLRTAQKSVHRSKKEEKRPDQNNSFKNTQRPIRRKSQKPKSTKRNVDKGCL